MRYVIIGTGAAGAAAARTIRRRDAGAEVILIGEERFHPYNRYLLTEFMRGAVTAEEVFHTAEMFLEEMDIKFRKGQRVERVNPEEKTLRFSHDEVMPYDKLLIATGRCPRLSPSLQPFEKYIQSYNTFEDTLVIRERLAEINHVIVGGEGLSKFDLICGMCHLGKRITYILKTSKVVIPAVDDAMCELLETTLQEKGVEVIRNDRIIGIEPLAHGYRVETFQGAHIEGDIVFAADSYKPNIKCVQGTNIEVHNGILVDLELRTSASDIYAAGDCVEIYHPEVRNYWINYGWPNAEEQGVLAGGNMAGEHKEYQIHDTLVYNVLGKPFKARWWD